MLQRKEMISPVHFSELILLLEMFFKRVRHHQATQFTGKQRFFDIVHGSRVGGRDSEEDQGAAAKPGFVKMRGY
jgi:hypothetical protein